MFLGKYELNVGQRAETSGCRLCAKRMQLAYDVGSVASTKEPHFTHCSSHDQVSVGGTYIHLFGTRSVIGQVFGAVKRSMTVIFLSNILSSRNPAQVASLNRQVAGAYRRKLIDKD